MPNDRANINAQDVDVFISAAGADHSDGSVNHTLVGWCESGSIVAATEENFTVTLHNETDHQLGVKVKLSAAALEVSSAQITALEGFINSDIDIVLINRADRATGWVYAGGNLTLSPDFGYSLTAPNKLNLEAMFVGKVFTDIYSTLAAATGY